MAKLLRTNTLEYRNNVYQYILDCIDYQETENGTAKDKIKLFFEEFSRCANHPYNLKRFPNNQERIADYLQGLPIAIDYTNYDILQVAKKLHNTSEELTTKQENAIIENWFNHIAYMIIKLGDKLNVNK